MGQISNTILSNSIWQIIQRIGGRLLGMLLMIMLARKFGAAQYGLLVYAIAFANLFIIIADYGMATLSVRSIARASRDPSIYISSVSLLKIMLATVAFMLIVGTAYVVPMEPSARPVLAVVALYLLLENVGSFLGSVFQAYEKMAYNTAVELVQRLMVLTLCAFLFERETALITFCLVMLAFSLLHSVAKVYFIHTRFARFTRRISKRIWLDVMRQGLPLAAIGAISMLHYNIDTVMLEFFKGKQAVGWYGVSYQLYYAMATLSGALLSAAYPVMSRFYVQEPGQLAELYRKCFKLIAGFGCPLTIGCYLLRDDLVTFLYGSAYQESVQVFGVFSLIIFVSLLNGLTGYMLTATDREKPMAWSLAGTTALNIFLNLLLIPRYGYLGAAWATVASTAFLFVASIRIIPRKLRPIPFAAVLKIMTAAVLMGLAIHYMAKVMPNLYALCILGAAVYFSAAYLLNVMDRDEKRILIEFLAKYFKKNNSLVDAEYPLHRQ